MHDLNNQPLADDLAAERFQASEDATRLAWENAPANQIRALNISPETIEKEVLQGEAGTDHFKAEDTSPQIRGLSSPIGYFEEGSSPVLTNQPIAMYEAPPDDDLRVAVKSQIAEGAITNELTIEPGVTGSLKNAGVLLDPPPGFSEGTYTSTDGQRKDIRDLNLLDVMNSVELQHPSNVGKSTPLTPELIVDGGESYQRKSNRASNILMATALGLAAGTGLPMPEFKLPSRFRQERKDYDPKPESAEDRNLRSAWNFGVEQNKQAKKEWKKNTPRSERVLPKIKKKPN